MADPVQLPDRLQAEELASTAGAASRPSSWPRPWVWAGSAVGLLSIALFQWARAHPAWVEDTYSESLFPHIREALGSLARLLPISLAELLLVALMLFGWIRLVRAVQELRRGVRSLGSLLLGSLYAALGIAGFFYASFLCCWGLNHARQPYGLHAGLPPQQAPPTADELAGLLESLVVECNQLRPRFETSALELQGGPGQADPRVLRGFEVLAERVGVFSGLDPVFRKPWSSPLLSRLGILGIYSPFTAEAHVNVQAPIWSQPFSACHEVAHAAGFAREDEANFIAWQACRASGDEAFGYSAAYVGLLQVKRALQRLDARRVARILKALQPFVLEDQRVALEFWRSKHSVVTEVSQSTNDAYLKSQGQADGTLSYGRMVALMIAEWRQRGAPAEER